MISKTTKTAERRGLAMIMVIAFYAIAVAMIGVWVRSALDRQKQVRQWQEKTQAVWLAEAGVRRAIARAAADQEYTSEVWQIDATDLGGLHAAMVAITVERADSPANTENESTNETPPLQITAVASYPAGTKKRVQYTKTIHYPTPVEITSSGESP